MPPRNWRIPPVVAADSAAPAAGLSPVAWQLLAVRGWIDEEGGIRPGWDGPVEAAYDPNALPDMPRAVDRLAKALDSGERIVVHGDYDADGISGTALLCGGLRDLGAEVQAFVPDRIRDGYGVASRLVERCGQSEVRILITVDTGSSAHEALGRAAELGVDVVVCDHHLLDEDPAPAFALINPQRADGNDAHRDLCGCAVAYKLLHALHLRLGRPEPVEQLDLVAVATVADQVPMRGENRALVRRGLARLRSRPRPGLAALLERCRLAQVEFDESDLAFQIAPRINAAGRIERPRTALDLLLSREGAESRRLAARCDDLNQQRKRVQHRVSADARVRAARLMQSRKPEALVLAQPSWHFGVVGISAAQIAAEFERPTVLLAIDGDLARGSARSAGGVNLKLALDECADLLLRHGGHAEAAGLLMSAQHVDALQERFARAVRDLPREESGLGLRIDARAQLADVDLELVEFLQRLGPFGATNPRPHLVSEGLTVDSWRPVGGDHLKLRLRDGERGDAREFIGFSMLESWKRESADAA